jgi:ubiquinone/menaquinone biosynthesis C-methylase UbiE
MSVYEGFALFYTIGTYTQYGQRMAELLPNILERYQAKPETVLDLACGEGTFAILMSKAGYKVTGVDKSKAMLRIAKERIDQEQVAVELLNLDMRELSINQKFDLVTCWFDSLNYLLKPQDLVKTFKGVSKGLKPDGLFMFDMNTIYGLAVNWQRQPIYIEQDTPDVFVVHQPDYDYEHNLATMRITGFMRDQDGWFRMDEKHIERGYTLEDIQDALRKANLDVLDCWGSIMEMTSPAQDTGRVWFVVRKTVEISD